MARNTFDAIVLGGGVSGLYAANEMARRQKDWSIALLEKSHRLGGRVRMISFCGANLPDGAGVGRWGRDTRLKRMVDKYGPAKTVAKRLKIRYGITEKRTKGGIRLLLHRLSAARHRFERSRDRMIDALKRTFTPKEVRYFIDCIGYTDYLKADIWDTLADYGLSDALPGAMYFRVPWQAIVDGLETSLLAYGDRIELNMGREVTGVRRTKNQTWKISVTVTVKGQEPFREVFYTHRLICGLAVPVLGDILGRESSVKGVLDAVAGQPFFRAYGQVDHRCTEFYRLVDRLFIVDAPLRKIIPMDRDKGVFMIAYCDNDDAVKLKHVCSFSKRRSMALLEIMLSEVTGTTVKLLDLHHVFWEVGTHYFNPLPSTFASRNQQLKTLQRPEPNLYLVGEALSRNQGWVEGALESVDRVLKTIG